MPRPSFNHSWVDETRDPFYVCKYPDPLPQDEYEAFVAHLDKWTAEVSEPYAWILYPDLKTSKQRSQMAESQARRAQYEKLYCSSYGFVVTDPLARGVITAVTWLNPPPVITKVFDNENAALIWVSQRHRDFVERFNATKKR